MARSFPRRLPMRPLALAMILMALVFAGCIEEPAKMYDTPRDDAVPIEIHVYGEGDPERPVAGAEVALVGIDDTKTVQSDPDGIARFWVVPANGPHLFGVRVTTDNWTQEELADSVQVDPSSRMVRLVAPVYHTELQIGFVHDWEEPVTFQMVGERSQFAQELEFSDRPDVMQAYARRIDTITVAIGWENDPTTHADLGVFIQGNGDGEPDDRTVRTDDDQAPLHQGAAAEEVTTDRDWLVRVVDLHDPQVFYGIETDEPVVAPEGLPITVNVTATFRTPPIEVGEGPAPAVWVLLVLVAVGAVLQRVRGRPALVAELRD